MNLNIEVKSEIKNNGYCFETGIKNKSGNSARRPKAGFY